MTIIVVENLRGFFNSRPPLVVFMLCLASFAIALITSAYLVRTRDLPNPDVSEDWNSFLTKFSELEFCVSSTSTADLPPLPPAKNLSSLNDLAGSGSKVGIGGRHPADMLEDIQEKIKGGNILSGTGAKAAAASSPAPPPKAPASRIAKRSVISAVEYKGEKVSHRSTLEVGGYSVTPIETSTVSLAGGSNVNVTVPLNMEIIPSAELRAVALQTVHLSSMVHGTTFKLKGPGREHTVHISLAFPVNLSKDNCEERDGNRCSLYVVNTCVTFSGPAVIFPRSQRPDISFVCEGNVTTVAADSHVLNMTANALSAGGGTWCAGGSRLTAEFSFDEALTVLLSQQDRSMINLHLMRTSYFLFVMVITLFCYAMVRGRPTKVKTVHVPYEKVTTNGP